jgi:uncharacterized protein (TIGR00730 family)
MTHITVYCSSSSQVSREYHAAAEALGRAIAAEGWKLVYGGNRIGLMGALAHAVRAGGGRVIGITPRIFIEAGVGDDECDELIISANMRDRKEMLEQRGDALLALPGGLGTFEELFEVIVSRKLGYHDKPIVILNIAGYYDALLAMIENGIEQKFINGKARGLFFVAANVPEAIAYLRKHHAGAIGQTENPASID